MNSKIAVVTGASAGIGQACATALVAEGWTTVFVGRDGAKLQAAVAALPADQQALAETAVCDVTNADAVKQLFDDVAARHGRLDLLFNNAGVNQAAVTPDELSADDWRKVVGTNLDGAFYCLSNAFRIMRHQSPQGGRIINNGSISAHTPRPCSIAYAASKSAITGLTRGAALDGAPACHRLPIPRAIGLIPLVARLDPVKGPLHRHCDGCQVCAQGHDLETRIGILRHTVAVK